MAQDVWSIGVMFFVLLTQYFPWDHPLPSDVKHNAFVRKDIRSSILVVVACPQPRPGLLLAILSHISSPQFLHERVFVAGETMRGARSTSDAEHAVVPGQCAHVARALNPHCAVAEPQFITKSSVEKSASS